MKIIHVEATRPKRPDAKKYFVIFERKVTERVIERAYLNHPYPNADGTIDYYEDHLGKFESLASIQADTIEEAKEYFTRIYPTIVKEDECQLKVKDLGGVAHVE